MRVTAVATVLGFVGACQAFLELPKPMRPMRSTTGKDSRLYWSDNDLSASDRDLKEAYFDQLIDHSRPELGTFRQRYYYSTMYYNGPGSPISVDAPPEAALRADYVDPSNATMSGFIAQQIGGAYIAIEHRYYGASTPIEQDQYDAEHLQPLTLENAVDDLVYFARNVKLPFDPNGLSHPDKAPWMLSGCSYPGALSAWTQKLAPGTFWAHEAGSAVVQTRNSLWQYFLPIEKAMPQNCSADWKLVMAHIDDVLLHGSDADKTQLKSNMGADGLSDALTAYSAIEWLFQWQNKQYATNDFTQFLGTCDYLEDQVPPREPLPGPEGVGLEKALAGFFRSRTSGDRDSADKPQDSTTDPWLWQLCNEPFQWWQANSPNKSLHMTSALLDEQWFKDSDCHEVFPPVGKYKVGIDLGRDETIVNRLTGGWDGANNLTRIAWVNADLDPWLYATVSSPDRPGGPQQGTGDAPLYMLRGTAHCNDYYTVNGDYNDDAREMFTGVGANMKKWAAEFYELHNITRPE
ncbi:hypothetical protein PWT90_07981 [Aphanocladium album]|nr:hypothetical protein PWT90_07981 [Aphanocladium album]